LHVQSLRILTQALGENHARRCGNDEGVQAWSIAFRLKARAEGEFTQASNCDSFVAGEAWEAPRQANRAARQKGKTMSARTRGIRNAIKAGLRGHKNRQRRSRRGSR
jgi:hypothetical protein